MRAVAGRVGGQGTSQNAAEEGPVTVPQTAAFCSLLFLSLFFFFFSFACLLSGVFWGSFVGLQMPVHQMLEREEGRKATSHYEQK